MKIELLGKELKDTPIVYSLRSSIYGIGLTISKEIIKKLNIDESKRPKDLSNAELHSLNTYVRDNVQIEADLRNKVKSNCLALVKKGCYRGKRHILKLPVRGQRTSTNAKTNKKLGRRYVL